MIHNFTEQFEAIQNDAFREFAVEAFQLYTDDESGFVPQLKTIVNYLIELCDVVEAEDAIKDIIIVAGLLHAVGDGTMDARIKLMPFMPTVGREGFNNILYLIERQDGFATPYPEYQPLVDSPIHTWLLPIAKHLAKGG